MNHTDTPGDLPTIEQLPPLAVPAEVAAAMRSTENALAKHRSRGTGPAYIKHGQRVLYRREAVLAYLTNQTVETHPTPAA